MKKKLYVPIIMMLVVTILFTLSACSVHKNKLYDIEREIHTYEGVKCVTEKEKYSVDDTVIQYTMTNISGEDVWINSDDTCFELQKLVDGKWKWVSPKFEHVWTDEALLLPANETETREINLDDYFYLPLEKGEYRIVIENIISNTFEIS